MKIILVFVCILICAASAKRCTGRRRSGSSCRSQCNYSTGQWVSGFCAASFIPPELCEYYCESPREAEGQKTKCSYEYSGGGELGREIPAQTGSCDDESGPCYAPCMCEQYDSFCNVTNTCIPHDAPCGDLCDDEYDSFCNVTNTCIPHAAPCGDRCDDEYTVRTFCPLSQTCNSQSEPCGGKCAPPLRLCADQRCLDEQSPCNATCPPHLQYCMVSYSCLQYNETCPCPPNTWGCRMYKNADGSLTTEYQSGQSRQQQCDLAAGDTTPTEGCSVKLYHPGSSFYTTSVSAGNCHPKFVKNITGQCVPRE